MSDCQAASKFYERLCESPRIRVVRKTQIDSYVLYRNQTEPFHDDLNCGWAKPLIRYNPNKYELSPLPKFQDPIDSPLELDPSDTPKMNSSQKIEKSKVQEFLFIKPTPQIEGVHELSEVSKPDPKYPFDVHLPAQATDIKSLITLELRYFKISNLEPGEQGSGFVQIYDFDTYNPLSEPIYFTLNESVVKYSQTDQRVIYVPIRNLQVKLTLVCFLQRKPADSPVYNLYACNYCTLYDDDKNLSTDIKFPLNWFHINNWKDNQSMFTIDETMENNFVQIDSKIEVMQIKDMNVIKDMKFTYSWKEKSNFNFSALPLYPLPDVPSPIGSIFNLHFTLNNPPSNSYLYMKAIAINESGEINIKDVENNAKRLSIFPQEDCLIKDTFITSASPSSNEYSTPECIRIFVNQEITENTLIVLFLMSRQEKKGKIKEEVYKVGVIQLKNEDANLQITQRIPLFDYKGFPKKYLSQPKKMNKTFLQYTIALPPVFFPTPFCKQLFYASEGNIPEFPQDMNVHLSSVIIPIVAKLLSFKSNKMIDRLLTLLEMFKNSPLSPSGSLSSLPTLSPPTSKKEKKDKNKSKDLSSMASYSSLSFIFNGSSESKRYSEMLSYWLLTNFDSSTCKPDIFCENLREYINESVLSIQSTRQKYENTREMIHEINSGQVDLSSAKFISSAQSPEDSKTNSKRETKKEKKENLKIQTQIADGLLKAKNSLNRIMDNIDIILNIVTATVSHYIKQNKKELKDDYIPRSQTIVDFFKEFGRFLVEMDFVDTPDETILKAAKKFAQVLYTIQTFFTNKELCEIVFQNLYDTSINIDINNRTKQISLKIQLIILQALSYTPNLFVAAASTTRELNIERPYSPYNRVFGQIYKMAENIFKYDTNEEGTEDIIALFCGNLSVLTGQLENGITDDQVRAHVCYFLLPFILKMSSYFEPLSKLPKLQASVIPFILYTLNGCDPKYLYHYYHGLSLTDQVGFITFLKSIAKVSLDSEIVQKYGFIKQISQRLLNVLLVIVNGLKDKKVIEIVVGLNKLLLFDNEYQTPLNYPNFYNFLAQLMTKQRCNKTLIHLLLENINAKYHSLRCLCTSLLSWQINADYKHNKDIIHSSISIADSLTEILLKKEADDIQTYRDLVILIEELAPSYYDDSFTEMVSKRMKSARVIADVVEQQKRSNLPTEIRCRETMKIADEYKLLPSMRIQWLQRILDINEKDGNYVSAFVTQMHIVALIASVYDYKRRIELKNVGMNAMFTAQRSQNIPLISDDSSIANNSNANTVSGSQVLPDPPFHLMIVRPIENAYPKFDYMHSQPYLDFEFLPEAAEETQIKFDEFQKGAWELIQSFDFNMLQKEVDYAFELGMKAELFYSLRPLASFLLRLFYISRNYEGMARASGSLQKALLRVSYESCTLIHDVNLQFYLVEMKNDNGDIDRQVYCVKLGEKSPRSDYESETQIQLQNQNSAPQSQASSAPKSYMVDEEEKKKNEDFENLKIGSGVKELDKKFIKLIYSKERFGERKPEICATLDPNTSPDSDVFRIVRLEPTGNIPVDDEDPHCWNNFQTHITRKLIEKTKGDNINIVEIETKDFAPHYKMTISVKDFRVVEKSKIEIVREIALYSAAVLDLISENLEAYFEYDNAETWNISSDESYNYEFADKLHIVQSVLGMNEKANDEEDDISILSLLTALKNKNMDEAKTIVQDIIQPSLKRAMMIFHRGKKELTTMTNYIDNVGKTYTVANDFLYTFGAEQIKEDECYQSTTNSVWKKFKFEQDINY